MIGGKKQIRKSKSKKIKKKQSRKKTKTKQSRKKTYNKTAQINKNEIKSPIKIEYKYCFKKFLDTSI